MFACLLCHYSGMGHKQSGALEVRPDVPHLVMKTHPTCPDFLSVSDQGTRVDSALEFAVVLRMQVVVCDIYLVKMCS